MKLAILAFYVAIVICLSSVIIGYRLLYCRLLYCIHMTLILMVKSSVIIIVNHHRYSVLLKSFPVLMKCRRTGLCQDSFYISEDPPAALTGWQHGRLWGFGPSYTLKGQRQTKFKIESTSFLCFLADVLSTSMMQTEKIYENMQLQAAPVRNSAPIATDMKLCSHWTLCITFVLVGSLKGLTLVSCS